MVSRDLETDTAVMIDKCYITADPMPSRRCQLRRNSTIRWRWECRFSARSFLAFASPPPSLQLFPLPVTFLVLFAPNANGFEYEFDPRDDVRNPPFDMLGFAVTPGLAQTACPTVD